MPVLYFFESIRNPVLDAIFGGLTYLGDETAFLLLVMVAFWCMDKRCGYYLCLVGFLGHFCNQTLKMTFRVPRPWVLDPNFTIVESAREAATGYSFPSGHTQSAVGAFGALAVWNKRTWIRAASIAVAVLVPISRLYLGVHSLKDVLLSMAIALVLIAAGYFFMRNKQADSPWVGGALAFVVLVGALCVVYLSCYPFPADVDPVHLTDASLKVMKLAGAALGLFLGWYVDRKWVGYDTKAVWWAQILKLLGGVALVFAIKEGVKIPLRAVFSKEVADTVRYFLMAAFALGVWPMTFKWFGKMGSKGKGSVPQEAKAEE